MKRLLCIITLLACIVCIHAQIRGNNINIMVQPDHADWNYTVGEKATFKISVLKSGTPLAGASISYEAGPEMYPDIKKSSITLKDGTMTVSGSLKQTGFYRVKVTATVNGKKYDGMCTAAFSPENIRPAAKDAEHFDDFWKQALTEARWTALEPTKVLLPERCTKDANAYEVSFHSNSWGSRIYGILTVPTKPGKYPALLRVPGAGVRPYGGDVWTTAKGVIVLEIGIHGISVTQQQKIYDDLRNGALNNYWDTNLDDPDHNYYKRVVCGAVRAVDYIATLTEWNGTDLGVTGSSQGGFLTLATAALDSRVTCIGVVHDAMCDYEAELKNVAGGWPHYFYNKQHVDSKRIEGARYYDGVNFARRVKCKGWYSFGYNDDVVPPTSSYGLYNIVTAPKTLSVYQQTGHYWYQEQWDEWQAWLLQALGVEK